MGNTPVNVQHTGPGREEGERGGLREEGEIRGHRLISFSAKNSLIKYLQQLSVVRYIGHLWPVGEGGVVLYSTVAAQSSSYKAYLL